MQARMILRITYHLRIQTQACRDNDTGYRLLKYSGCRSYSVVYLIEVVSNSIQFVTSNVKARSRIILKYTASESSVVIHGLGRELCVLCRFVQIVLLDDDLWI